MPIKSENGVLWPPYEPDLAAKLFPAKDIRTVFDIRGVVFH